MPPRHLLAALTLLTGCATPAPASRPVDPATPSAAPAAQASAAPVASAQARLEAWARGPHDPGEDDRVNAATARGHVEAMVASTGSGVRLDACRMYPGTRAGQCLLSGTGAETQRFVEKLRLPEQRVTGDATVYSLEHCLGRPELGEPPPDEGAGSQVRRPRPGVRLFKVDPGLAPNRDNVQLRRLYADPGLRSLCLEFDYPYG